MRFNELTAGNKFQFTVYGVVCTKMEGDDYSWVGGRATVSDIYGHVLPEKMTFKNLAEGVKFRFPGDKFHYTKGKTKGYSRGDLGFVCGNVDREVEILIPKTFAALKIGAEFYWVNGSKCYVKISDDMFKDGGAEKYVHNTKRSVVAF